MKKKSKAVKPRTKSVKDNCMYPECPRESDSRGMCKTHARTMRELVHSGKTTYEKMEKAGVIRPPRRQTVDPAYFLGDKKK